MKPEVKRALDAFVANGWTPAQSAGIVANLVAESGLRPDAVGDGGLAYGVAQWHPPRQAGFPSTFGKPIQGSALDEQLRFVHAELTSTERAAGDRLKACLTAADAGAVVSMYYERPADRDGEAKKRAKAAEAIYAEYAPAQPSVVFKPVQEKKPMPILALLSAFGPIIAQLIPQIATIMQPKGEVAQRNVQLAQVAFDTITKAADSPNIQTAVETMQADPTVLQRVKEAVVTEPTLIEVLEVNGKGVDAARAANVQLVQAADAWWKLVLNPVLIVTLLTLPLVYIIVIKLVEQMSKVSADVIAQTIGTIVGLVLGGVMGFWMGQTYTQSNRKSNEQPPAVAQ